MWDRHLGRVTIAKHRIEMNNPDVRPIHSAPHLAGSAARAVEKEDTEMMSKMGFIDPTLTEWAAPIVFDGEKDGSLRFCENYMQFNDVHIGDAYPIPCTDAFIYSLGDAPIFSTLNSNCGYCQVYIEETDHDEAAFTSNHGLYLFIRVPFGLKNAPGTLQRSIDAIPSTARS